MPLLQIRMLTSPSHHIKASLVKFCMNFLSERKNLRKSVLAPNTLAHTTKVEVLSTYKRIFMFAYSYRVAIKYKNLWPYRHLIYLHPVKSLKLGRFIMILKTLKYPLSVLTRLAPFIQAVGKKIRAGAKSK